MKIGVDIGGSHAGVGIVNEKYQIIDKIERDWTVEEKNNLWNVMPKLITELINKLLIKNNLKEVESIGIGFPDSKIIDGIIYGKGEPINLKFILEPIFKTNVYVRNDAKCSGMCEKKIGNLKEYDNALFLTLGTGIGGAYFYKNELVVPNGYAGFEFGSMIIQKDGKLWKSEKNGCFEAYAAMKIFRKEVQELFRLEKVTSDIVLNIIKNKEKEEEMNKIIEEYIDYLSLGISNLIRIFEPDAIGIGGSFVYYKSIFMDKLESKLKEKFNNRDIPQIVTAKYENDAGIIGASMLKEN